jgi:hypothetical protein
MRFPKRKTMRSGTHTAGSDQRRCVEQWVVILVTEPQLVFLILKLQAIAEESAWERWGSGEQWGDGERARTL